MAKTNPRQAYLVLSPYRCPNKGHWHKKDDEVQLLPCEAQFLVLTGKIKAKQAVTKGGK